MADVNRGDRPLSPHISIYRPQLTSMTSILTRITGNALLITTLLIVWWFLAAASSPEAFEAANGVLTSWFGDLVMALSLLGIWTIIDFVRLIIGSMKDKNGLPLQH